MKPHNQGLWYLLQAKRLLKKPSFVVLLALLPLLVWGLSLTEAQESGMLHIALCAENPDDELSTGIVNELLRRRSVLNFTVAASLEEAYALVRANGADAAWVFPDGMRARLNDFAAYGSPRKPFVLIIEREDNVALQLAREVLYGALGQGNAYAIYRSFILENIADDASEAEIERFFAETGLDGNWLARTYLDYEPDGNITAGYLTAPLRGILALFVVLCGLASCLYYKQDKEKGLYVPFSLCYHLPAVALGGVGALLALALTGYATAWYREALLMVLLVLAVAVFADLLRLLLRKAEYLAAAIPIVVLLMLVLCPVFFTIRTAGFFPWLLPPFYYLNAVYNQTFVYYFGGYVLALFVLRLTISVNKKLVATAAVAAALAALMWSGDNMREVQANPSAPLAAMAAGGEAKESFLSVTLVEEEELPIIDEPAPPKYLIAIDPGHQGQGNNGREPIGPGAKEDKRKVAVGTIGTVTRVMEHELNLAVSLKLRDELLARGYAVYMTRESADVDISNVERAIATNEAGADITVRIHANGLKNREVSGIMTLCTTSKNRYVPHMYAKSRALSEAVLAAMVEATGARDRGIWEVDNLSGLNWSEMPNTLVEMGFMTNPAEDRLMQTEEYQLKLVKGIADGIEVYFHGQEQNDWRNIRGY